MRQIRLELAKEDDANLIHDLQYQAFLPLYEKYHDDETSPVMESLETTKDRITESTSDFYLIKLEEEAVGAVRIKCKVATDVTMISPLFLLPEYQNQGIGQIVLHQLFLRYPDTLQWMLYTIKQEKGNCHLYKKCGFVQTGDEKKVNAAMTLLKYVKCTAAVRRFKLGDADEVRNLICRNFLEVNVKDYGKRAMESLSQTYDVDKVIQVATYAHTYVFEWKKKIVAVGSIASYWGSQNESILLSIFVLPELHGRGLGRFIINTLEADELFIRAKRIEIPASITAVDFYRRFGYDYKNKLKVLDEEKYYRLEKFNHV